MLDVHELEKKWSTYHFKKMLPLYVSSAIVAAIIGLSSYLYLTNPEAVLALFKEAPKPVNVPILADVNMSSDLNKSVEPRQITPMKKEDEQNVLVASFDFMYNLEDQAINYNNAQMLAAAEAKEPTTEEQNTPPVEPKKTAAPAAKPKKQKKAVAKPKKAVKQTPKKPPKKKEVKPAVKKTVTQAPVKTVVIRADDTIIKNEEPQNTLIQVGQSETSEDELRGVIKRFNQTQKPALSLFVAKEYYEQGNYQESLHYAKATYDINPNIEDGVLLYAKSLVKLGKNDTAVSKLKNYIKTSGSVKAKILLVQIQKGTLK